METNRIEAAAVLLGLEPQKLSGLLTAATAADGELLRRKQVAKRLGLCERTLQNLEAKGLLHPVKLTPRAVRYQVADVERFIAAMTLEVPAPVTAVSGKRVALGK